MCFAYVGISFVLVNIAHGDFVFLVDFYVSPGTYARFSKYERFVKLVEELD